MISVSQDKTTTGTLWTNWVICTNTSALSRTQELTEEVMFSACKTSDIFNRKTSADHKRRLLPWLYLNYTCILIVIPKEENRIFFKCGYLSIYMYFLLSSVLFCKASKSLKIKSEPWDM